MPLGARSLAKERARSSNAENANAGRRQDTASTSNLATGPLQHVENSVLTHTLHSHYSRKVRHTLWCISEKRDQKDGNQPGEGAAAHLTQRERTAHYFCALAARTLHMLILRQGLCQAKRSWYLELQSLQKDNRWWCLDSIDTLSCDRQIVRVPCESSVMHSLTSLPSTAPSVVYENCKTRNFQA